jgi:hypothetical protein
MLDEVKVMHFLPIGQKKQIYFRIGYWIRALKGNITILQLCITFFWNEFAKIAGKIGIKCSHFKQASALESSDEADLSSESTLEEANQQVRVEQLILLWTKMSILFFTT